MRQSTHFETLAIHAAGRSIDERCHRRPLVFSTTFERAPRELPTVIHRAHGHPGRRALETARPLEAAAAHSASRRQRAVTATSAC